MKKGSSKVRQFDALRRRAEKQIAGSMDGSADMSTADIKRLIHELHVHQIELEMQNEELQKSHVEMVESQQKYSDLYDFAPVGYFTFNTQGTIIETNITGSSLLGIERRSLINQPFLRFIAPDYLNAFQSHLADALNTQKKQSCKLRLVGRDASLIDVLIHTVAVTDDNGPSYNFRSSVADISDIARAETALKEQTRQLENAMAELGTLSYSVAHDLRAPLRAIDGYARLILKKQGDKFDQDTLDKFNVIRSSAHLMGRLIDDLLTFSRLGRKQISLSYMDMNALVADARKGLKESIGKRNIKLAVDLMPPAYGDRALIKQVLINLLSNAVKFTKYKDAAEISVGGYAGENETVYYVRDNGAGFNMAYYDKLFGVFQKLHSVDQFEGTGVGLAEVQRIIQRHNGRVWAEGKVDGGATFYFALPSRHTHVKEWP